MSGICGIIALPDAVASVTDARLRAMAAQQRHRGRPHLWLDRGVGLCQHDGRADGTRMPLTDGRHHLVLDGDPGRSGGPDALLKRIAGVDGPVAAAGAMRAALAVWDHAERRLTLARDRLGEAPLYYVHDADGTLYFGSEIKALLAADAVRPALAYEALPDYLAFGAPTGERTLFDGVRRVPPGHALVWQGGRIRLERHWNLCLGRDRGVDEDELLDPMASALRAAVAAALDGAGSAGVILTGEPYSRLIAAIADTLLGEPVPTFALRPPTRAVVTPAFHAGTLTPEDCLASLPAAVWHEDGPLATPGSLALFHLCGMAADHVDVVLTGLGGEELVGGGRRNARLLLALRIARAYRRAFGNGARRPMHLYLEDGAVFSAAQRADLLAPEARDRAGGVDPCRGLEPYLEDTVGQGLSDALLRLDVRIHLQEQLTVHEHAATAAAVDLDAPFLDPATVDLATRLPSRVKRRHSRAGALLSRIAAKPNVESVARPDPDLTLPVAEWFRGPLRPLVHEYLLSDRTMQRGILRADAVGHLVAAHESRRADHSARLWSLVNLEMWQRLYLDGEVDASTTRPARAVAG